MAEPGAASVRRPPAPPAAAAAPAAAMQTQQQQQQQRPQPSPAAAAAPTPTATAAAAPSPSPVSRAAAVDAIIDEVLGGGLSMPERQLAADEMAYAYFSAVREAAGGRLTPEQAAELNALVAIPQEEKDAILQRTNRVTRRVLRPLGYKMLQLQGLDPAAVDPAAARSALQAQLSPSQQQAVDAEAERLFKEVYLPEMQSALEDAGLDVADPEQAWQEFGADIMARQPVVAKKQLPAAAVAVPAALAGVVVGLVLAKAWSWLQRRRRRRHGGYHSGSSSGECTAEDEYEDGGSGDSQQDEAGVYEG